MEKPATKNFILIDDDMINNMVCRKVIRTIMPKAHIEAFTDPEKGLSYVQQAFAGNEAANTILFLDINMPSLTGWDVLDKCSSFEDVFKERVKIFMLSSSINPSDKEKAARNKLVSGYISKPLSGTVLHTIVPGLA